MRATLGGVELATSQGFDWALVSGVNPYERTFFTTKARAERIASLSRELTFEVRSAYPTLRVQGLTVLSTIAGDENTSGVVVADRRWLLSRQHIVREYNIRKPSGTARLVGSERQPLNVLDSNPDLVLKRATTNNGKRWTAQEILTDVLTELVGASGFVIQSEFTLSSTVNDLTLDDPGSAALQRVLAYLPGAEIYCDLDGVLKVYNSLDQSEEKALTKARVTLPGAQVVKVDRSALRPANGFTSLFEREIEIRLDYDEEAPRPVGQTTTREAVDKPPRMVQNVIPVTDPTLTLNGETVARGSWLVFDDWLTAVAAKADFNADIGALSQTIIQEEFCSGFNWLRSALVKWQTGDSDLLWDQRLGAVLNHWRRTFRILPQHMDLYRSIRAVRVSILDTENGTRGKAEAYFDYSQQPTRRSITKAEGTLDNSGWIVNGYAEDLSDENARPGPADVVVLDPVNGIFQLQFRSDPLGDADKIVPGLIVGDIPKEFPEALSFPEIWEYRKLDPAWKLAVVLTVSPAAPNNAGRLHAENVSLQTAASLLPGVSSPGRATGPDWSIKVGAGIETARFGWVDAQATVIEEALYSGDPLPESLMVNKDTVQDVAEANAARLLSLLLDRYEGLTTVSLDPSIKPTGSLRNVVHRVGVNGAFTDLDLPPIQVPPDAFALLPESARRVLQRQVQE